MIQIALEDGTVPEWTHLAGDPSYPVSALLEQLRKDDLRDGVIQEAVYLVKVGDTAARKVKIKRTFSVEEQR